MPTISSASIYDGFHHCVCYSSLEAKDWNLYEGKLSYVTLRSPVTLIQALLFVQVIAFFSNHRRGYPPGDNLMTSRKGALLKY